MAMFTEITLTEDAAGVYVYDKSEKGFKVKEIHDGKSNATFDWVAIVKRAEEEGLETKVERASGQYRAGFSQASSITSIHYNKEG